MSKVTEILESMRKNPSGIRFAEACHVCEHFFGPPRQKGSSHCIYKTPWPGDPRVNIQQRKGMAKAYQMKQVLKAIEKVMNNETRKK